MNAIILFTFLYFVIDKLYNAWIVSRKPRKKLRWCNCWGRTIFGTDFGYVYGTNSEEFVDSRMFARQYVIRCQFDNQHVAERLLHGHNGMYLGTLRECKRFCEEDWWELCSSFERGNYWKK